MNKKNRNQNEYYKRFKKELEAHSETKKQLEYQTIKCSSLKARNEANEQAMQHMKELNSSLNAQFMELYKKHRIVLKELTRQKKLATTYYQNQLILSFLFVVMMVVIILFNLS